MNNDHEASPARLNLAAASSESLKTNPVFWWIAGTREPVIGSGWCLNFLFWVKFPKILIKSILEQVGKQTCCPPWIHKVPNDVSGVASAGALPPKASLEKHLANLQPFCIIC